MPMPVSRTVTRSRAWSQPMWVAETVAVTPPAAVNFSALPRRLSITWRISGASPTNRSPAPSTSTDRATPLSVACWLSRSVIDRTNPTGSNGEASSSTAPASRREKSSTLLTTASKVVLASWIRRAWRAWPRAKSGAARRTSEKPTMALSGVRSS